MMTMMTMRLMLSEDLPLIPIKQIVLWCPNLPASVVGHRHHQNQNVIIIITMKADLSSLWCHLHRDVSLTMKMGHKRKTNRRRRSDQILRWTPLLCSRLHFRRYTLFGVFGYLCCWGFRASNAMVLRPMGGWHRGPQTSQSLTSVEPKICDFLFKARRKFTYIHETWKTEKNL